ncbi:MFS transporter [Streptacidiphilus monticola]
MSASRIARDTGPKPTPDAATRTTTGSAQKPEAGRPAPSAAPKALLLAALLVAAFNLRPAVAGLGPMLDDVRRGLHMNAAMAGVLTALPSLCFALFGLLAPRLARRIGPAVTVCAGMAAIGLGLAARALAPDSAVFLLLSAVALAGIAVANVLMPVVVKRYFPDRVGPVTGLYSMSLSVGTSVAAAFAVPLTNALGGSWRVGLGVWALAAALAVVLWLAQLALQRRDSTPSRAAPQARPGRRSPAAGRPGCSPSSSACRRPPPTRRWAGCRRSCRTPASPPPSPACCSRSPWPSARRCRSSSRPWPRGVRTRGRSCCCWQSSDWSPTPGWPSRPPRRPGCGRSCSASPTARSRWC